MSLAAIRHGGRSGARRAVFSALASALLIGATAASGAAAAPRITVGPYAKHLDHTTVEIAWETDVALPSTIEYYANTRAKAERVENGAATTKHRVALRGVKPETIYSYRILLSTKADVPTASAVYTFDSTFDFTRDALPEGPRPFPKGARDEVFTEYADLVARHAGVSQGVCLVIGATEGRLAYEIACRTQMQIIVVTNDAQVADGTRRLLDEAGYYGARVSVHVGPLDKLPYADYMANVVVSETLLDAAELPAVASEWHRVLRPSGGMMLLGDARPEGTARENVDATQKKFRAFYAKAGPGDVTFPASEKKSEACVWSLYRRGELAGAGDWTHQYGPADNSACSQDELVAGELRPLWFGQPGARPMPDRGGRNPAPLASGGTLYVQGDRILFGMDAYNGSIRWVYQIPDLRRSNVPRDSSNMAASKDMLHIALGASCMNIDARSGEVKSNFSLISPPTNDTQPDKPPIAYDWGYLARVNDAVLGTAVRGKGRYVADSGEWYDGPPGWETEKVVGDNLFALNAADGAKRWEYRGGRVLNATITVADGRVYFVESRSPQAIEQKKGRLGDEALTDTYLVALDLATGKPIWQNPIDFGTGRRVLYLSHQDGTLVAAGSSDKYRLAAFDAATGTTKWRQEFGWKKDDHGGAIQHPTIVGGTVYTEFLAFALADGAARRGLPPRGHGCGAQSASKHTFFYRGGYHTMWDIAENRQTEIAPARSGCWLGIIPAGGIVIAPETSSGCSCTHALQTSMAFVPRASVTKGAPKATGK